MNHELKVPTVNEFVYGLYRNHPIISEFQVKPMKEKDVNKRFVFQIFHTIITDYGRTDTKRNAPLKTPPGFDLKDILNLKHHLFL